MNNKIIFDEYKNPVTIHTKEDFEKMRKAGKFSISSFRLYYTIC